MPRQLREEKTMATIEVHNLRGETVGSLELADEIFAPDSVNEGLVWEAVKHFRAAMRQGNAATKAPAVRASAPCVRRFGVMAGRSMARNPVPMTMPSRARRCSARCALRLRPSMPKAS